MWNELVGTYVKTGGTAGTVTLPSGASVVSITAVDTGGGGTIVLFGTTIVLTAAVPFQIRMNHRLCTAASSGAGADIVFTGTDSYFVEYVKAGNT
jgi:hypothetical protein